MPYTFSPLAAVLAGVLTDHRLLRVLAPDGEEIPAFTQPLAHWWIDGERGSLRSVLVQVEAAFLDATPQKVTLAWDAPRARSRSKLTPVSQTQFTRLLEPPADARQIADTFEYQCPKVLTLLPPEWLCASLLVWQQVPAAENKAAPWFDRHLLEKFGYELSSIRTGPTAMRSGTAGDQPAPRSPVIRTAARCRPPLAWPSVVKRNRRSTVWCGSTAGTFQVCLAVSG